MNVRERDQLWQFFSSLRHSPPQARDPVAEELIRDALADGISPYQLVQRALSLTLALQAAQARVAELEVSCARLEAELAQSGASPLADAASGANAAAVVSSTPLSGSVWAQDLLRQAGSTALGVAAGVVTGGLLLEGLQRMLGEDSAASPRPDASLAEGSALWEGDDWA